MILFHLRVDGGGGGAWRVPQAERQQRGEQGGEQPATRPDAGAAQRIGGGHPLVVTDDEVVPERAERP